MANKRIIFDCCKAAQKFSLLRLSDFFGISEFFKWSDCLKIDGKALAIIFKYIDLEKTIFIFDYGCIVFVNFILEEEKMIFFDFLRSLSFNINNDFIIKYRSSFILSENFEDVEGESEEYISLIAGILAKDTALAYLEENANVLLDESESIVESLKRAKLNISAVKYAKKIAPMLKFQYSGAYFTKVFLSNDKFHSEAAKKFYENLGAEYLFNERIKALEQKTNELRRVYGAYFSISQSWKENRLLYFEIALLAVFGLPYIFNFKFAVNFLKCFFDFLFGK